MQNEQRKSVRHPVRSRTFSIFSNYSPIKGWVKDISKEGMAFEYIPADDCERDSKIRLIVADDAIPLYISGLVCKVIYDIKINDSDRQFKGTCARRCGVQYEKLDAEMQENLLDLLKNEAIRSSI
jgi:hypothetical protein